MSGNNSQLPLAMKRRLPPHIYRRRRIALAMVFLFGICLTVFLIYQVAGAGRLGTVLVPRTTAIQTTVSIVSQTDALSSQSVAATVVPSQTPIPPLPASPVDPTAVALGGCVPANIAITPVTDKQVYGAGELPQLSFRVTNVGSASCTMNLGTSKQLFVITSGNDVYWRSTDCQTAGSDMEVTLVPGQPVTSSGVLNWDRTRSLSANCGAARETAGAGGASYHLKLMINGVASTSSKQFLLY